MNEENVVEERDGYRVIVEIDQYLEEPYDDGQSPVLRIAGFRQEHIAGTSFTSAESDERIEEAVSKWGGPSAPEWHLVEKYLRAFHGVTQIETYYSGSYYWYVTYDSAEWRDAVGLTEPGGADISAWKAYCEGEVYAYRVQKLVKWVTLDPALDPEDRARETWEDTEYSCSGLYGYEYAEQAALEALSEAAKETQA